MPIIGSGDYPTATDFGAAADRLVGYVSGIVQEIPPSVARFLPTGVVDATGSTAVAATLLEAADATTGWSATGIHSTQGIALDTTTKTQGTASVKCTLRVDNALAKQWFDFSSLQSITSRTYVAFDVYYDQSASGPAITDLTQFFVAEVADGTALSGNIVQLPYGPVEIGSWHTIYLPLTGLTGVRSVGVRSVAVSPITLARVVHRIDNIRFPAQSEVDAALHASATTVIVPASFAATDTTPRIPSATKTVMDLRPSKAHISRLGGFRHTREWNLNEDGVTDVSDDIHTILNSLAPGTTLDFPPNVAFCCERAIYIDGRKDIHIRFNRARFYMTAVRANDIVNQGTSFIEVQNSDNVRLDDLRVFGYREYVRNGSTMVATSTNLLSELNRGIEEFGVLPYPVWAANANCALGFAKRTGGGVVLEDNISIELDPTAAGDMSMRYATGTSGVPVKASTSYTFSVDTRPEVNQAARTIRIDATWYDAAGAVISTSTGTGQSQVVNVKTTITQAHTSPALAAFVNMVTTVIGTTADDELHSFDNFVIKLTTPVTLVTASTASTLSTMHAENRLNWGVPQEMWYGRDKDGYCHWSAMLSDTTHVANDCQIRVFDSVTGKILASSTVTLTATPTKYEVTRFMLPDDLGRRIHMSVRKMTTATNTITIASTTEYQPNQYTAPLETSHGIQIGLEARNIKIRNFEAEGVGGDAIACASRSAEGLDVDGLYSRCCMRQGASLSFARNVRFHNFIVREPGRSAFDFEPASADWFVDDVKLFDGDVYNARNYFMACAGWAHLTRFDVHDVTVYTDGLSKGFMFGGFRDSRIASCKYVYTTTEIGELDQDRVQRDWTVFGQNLTIEDCETPGGWMLEGDTGVTDHGPAYRSIVSSGILLRNCRLTSPYGRVLMYGHHKVENLTAWRENEPFATTSATFMGMLAFRDGAWSTIDVGQYAIDIPNTFKKTTAAELWFPGGLNMVEDPLYRVRSMSGTSVRGNNYGQRNVAVTTSATSKVITFPTRALPLSPFSLLGATGGTLTPSTTYYVRVAMRDRYGGPAVASAQQSIALTSGQNAISVKSTQPFDAATGFLRFGFTIYRGTTTGGPYTARFDIMPDTEWPSLAPSNGFIDIGTAATFAPIGDDSWGYPLSTPVTAGSFTPVDESGYEPDVDYDVFVSPSWLTTWRVMSKTTAGFTIEFGTPAPAGATASYKVERLGV